MQLRQTALAAILLASSQLASATTLESSRVTLSDVHFSSNESPVGEVGISEAGNVTTLNFTGMASQVFVARTGDTGDELWKTLYATTTAAEGYAVKSIRLRAVLDVTDINPPAQQALRFAFYLQTPSLMGPAWGEAYDGRSEDFTFQLAWENMDGITPFGLSFSTAAAIWPGPPVPADSYTSVGFRSIALDIETVPVVAQVPEPGTWAMLLTGLAGLGVAARRRKH